MTPTEAARLAAAHHGLLLTTHAATDIAAAILDAHDSTVTATDVVWREVWEREQQALTRALTRRLLTEASEHGMIPIELPRTTVRPHPTNSVFDGDSVEVQVTMRVRHAPPPAAYPRETQEMVFDAHMRAFEFFGGVCRRGIYDNLKAVVNKVLSGKERNFNNRFGQLCSHYLFEPTACTPAAGWEKGQVENQVGTVRRRFFVPRPQVKDYAELNEWLKERCLQWARSQPYPDLARCMFIFSRVTAELGVAADLLGFLRLCSTLFGQQWN